MGLASLKASSAWDTIPAGLAASGDEMALDRIEDSFNDGSLNTTNFGALTAANGTAKENEALELNSPAVPDGGAVYLKTAVSKVVSDIYTYSWRPQDDGQYPLLLQQRVGAPVIGSSAVINAIRVIAVYLPAPSDIGIFYIDNVGVGHGWDGAAWVLAFPNFSTVSLGTLYDVELEVDDVNARWRLIVKDITNGTTMTTTDWVLWSGTRDTGSGDLWFGAGDFYTDVISGKLIVSSFRNQFKTGPLVSTMGAVAVNTAIEQVPVTESLVAGAAIAWRYDIGAGFVTPGTGSLADLKTALIGTSPATLDLEASFTSGGDDGGNFDINGGVLAGTGTCDYPIEANVLDGIEYDSGNLTGTLKKYSVTTNPNDTKRKRILDVLDTRLKAISTVLGYKTDLGDNVFRWRVTEMNPFDPEEELPGVNYVDDDQRPEQSSHGPETVEHSMQVMLHVYATTESELRSARADIVEAIGADVGFSTLAQDAQLIDDGSDTAHEQDKIWSTEMLLQIMYTTGRWNPYE